MKLVYQFIVVLAQVTTIPALPVHFQNTSLLLVLAAGHERGACNIVERIITSIQLSPDRSERGARSEDFRILPCTAIQLQSADEVTSPLQIVSFV